MDLNSNSNTPRKTEQEAGNTDDNVPDQAIPAQQNFDQPHEKDPLSGPWVCYADVRADWGVIGGSSPSAHRGIWPCRPTLPSRTGSCGPDRERWKRRLAKDVQSEKLRRGATLVHHSVDHLIEMVVLRQVRRMPGLRAT